MKNFHAYILILLLVVVAGCSSSNNDALPVGGGGAAEQHPATWVSDHGAVASTDLRGCQGCHGFDFKGAGNAVSCLNCHSSGPPFVGAHPASWNADPLAGHQLNFQGTLSEQTPWTTCAVAACHGTSLGGGTAGPTCQNNTANCHSGGTNGWPPAPADHAAYAPATNGNHGLGAKGATTPSLSMGNYCLLCHGQTLTTGAPIFDGGFVTDVIGNADGNCTTCHTTATAHPTNWVSTRSGNVVNHNNGTLTAGIQGDSCALCHTTTGTSPLSPFPGAPTCFDSGFNGTNNCHATGPGGAPHAVPYTDPQLHGLAAKADPSATSGLVYCQSCHAEAGGAGSNPRFNVPKGSMTNGCEDCHTAGAHPTGTDRWTFDLDTTNPVRRTHFASGNSVNTACVLCHDLNAAVTVNGVPPCTSCHASTTTFTLNCTYCHEVPPVTNVTDLTGANFVDHSRVSGGDVTDVPSHENCSICHGASLNGTTGKLQSKGPDYLVFGDAGTEQGGNHLDNCIDVNGDVGYQDVNVTTVAERFGCAAACHPNDTGHQMSDSGLNTIDGSYTTGTIACTDCHGYPPNGTTAAPEATPSRHIGGTLGADLLGQHGDCQTCHGTKDDGAGSHAPVNSNYVPATNHYNGLINMNVTTAYVKTGPTAGGCDNAVCHGNDAAHRVPATSGLTVQDGDYGSGSCSSCHDYPPKGDKIPLTAPATTTPVSHMGSDGTGAKLLAAHNDCEVCHGNRDTGGAFDPTSPYVVGTHHQNDQVEMNSDLGYNSTTTRCESAACHSGGISPALSSAAPGLTVNPLALGNSAACDTCHGGLLTDSTPIATGSHSAHLTSTIGVNLTCTDCHGHQGSGTSHNDGNVDFNFSSSIAAAGSYTSPTCSNVYCHGTSNTIDWGTTGPIACGTCHGDSTGRPDVATEPSGGNHLTTSHLAETCDTCHPHVGTDTTNHVNGAANANGAAQITSGASLPISVHAYGTEATTSPDPDGFKYSDSTCTTTCHSSGTWGSAGGCDFCHGYPPDGTSGSTDHFTRTGPGTTDADFFNAHATCATCHGVAGNQVPPTLATARTGAINLLASGGDRYLDPAMHNDGSVQINGYSAATGDGTDDTNAGYNGTGGCAKACHASSYVINNLNTANTVEPREFGSGTCTSCHNGTGTGATLVNDLSSHAINTTLRTCEECHTGHGAGTIEIPNNSAVGINYSANGEAGIALGGTGTTGTTEAEICWNCHASFGQSEWGVNNQANTGSMTYNYGTLSGTTNGNWIGATWTSGTAKFSYKTGVIQSTHSVNDTVTTPGLDAVGEIRCSYCHDVHDLNQASGDTLSGAPYLRGTWMGNPYREDGAPQANDSWTTNNRFGAVPRGGTQAVELGGYQIDQNNGNPTFGWTLGSSAGLCTLCHGTDVDNMNKFGTASTDWVGTNGHSNAVIGGSGSNASNIFRIADRNSSPPTFINNDSDANSSGGNPAMAYQQISVGSTGNRGFGFRSSSSEPDGWNLSPQITNTYAHDAYNWGADTNNALDSLYHKFSCSKCHNPHASRLPRLLITNCLDTKHNTWDDQASVSNLPNSGSVNNDGSSTVTADNAGKTFSQATSAQNCHRVGDTGTGTGWNYVTPW